MASKAGSSSYNSFSGVQDLINCGAPVQFSYDYRGGHMMQVPSGLANFSSVDQKSVSDRFFQPVLMSRSALEMSKMTAQEIVEAKALAASKSHSEAEWRQRERINNHLATLRSLLPNTTKTNKASLLAEVIDHVRELKRMVDDTGQASPVHSEADEVSLEYPDPNEEGRSVIRASLCCEDRPELLSDLIKTLRSLRLRAVKAEIATLGGRVKNVLVVTSGDSQDPNDVSETPSSSSIKEALKAVMEKQNSGDLSPASSSGGNKRQRQVDMIALSGAHTVGFSHCSQFASRIYNFSPRRAVDPSLNSSYAAQLQHMCPRIVDPTIAINMDPTTPRQFDNVYYKNL